MQNLGVVQWLALVTSQQGRPGFDPQVSKRLPGAAVPMSVCVFSPSHPNILSFLQTEVKHYSSLQSYRGLFAFSVCTWNEKCQTGSGPSGIRWVQQMGSHVKKATLSPTGAWLSASLRRWLGYWRTPCVMSVRCMPPACMESACGSNFS